MSNSNVVTTGGFISCEVKLAIALGLVVGDDAFDLAVIFYVHSDHCDRISHEVSLNWVNATGMGDLNTKKHIGDEDTMEKASRGFTKRSNDALKGAIGTIDGWLVYILRPGWIRDRVRNPATIFSRKDLFWFECPVYY